MYVHVHVCTSTTLCMYVHVHMLYVLHGHMLLSVEQDLRCISQYAAVLGVVMAEYITRQYSVHVVPVHSVVHVHTSCTPCTCTHVMYVHMHMTCG